MAGITRAGYTDHPLQSRGRLRVAVSPGVPSAAEMSPLYKGQGVERCARV